MGRHATPHVPPPLGRMASGRILTERDRGGVHPSAERVFPIGDALGAVDIGCPAVSSLLG
jgi:hypothetical protein